MTSQAEPGRAARFGVFEVNTETGELRKNGVKLKLQEQPFQVLLSLLERSGKVVAREALIDQLWPNGTVVDYEHSLGTAVNKIRQVLGDSAENPRFVETVPRRGYRFLADVEWVGNPSNAQKGPAPAWPPRPGGLISHYEIVEKIGEGGMGVVYKAEDTKLRRTVALKFLPAHLLGDQELKARFVREAQAAAGLHHANICTVYEIDEFEGRTFIAMAFLEGAGLDKKIEAGPLKLNAALDIAMQTAEGLQAAHEKGIVHRDIKPANLMVAGSGSKQHLTIMDFGLAQLAGRSKLTRKDETMGTAAYMSPEQTYGAEVDHRTDIWALGIVIYETVTGQQPFKGHYDKAVMYSITSEAREPMTALRTGVPMELERVVNKALAKKAEERYQRLDEMLVDLRALQLEMESAPGSTPSRVASAAGGRPPIMPTAVAWHRRLNLLTVVLAAVALLAVSNGVTWWLSRSSVPLSSPTAQYALTQLTRDPGISRQPVISPDGDLVAYSSDRAGDDNLDIYVQQIGGGGVIQLTDHAAHDRRPEFSPDGKTIAFDSEREGGGIYLVPALGGDPRLLVRGRFGSGGSGEAYQRFSPDGQWILYGGRGPVGGDWVAPVAGGEPRELSRPEALDGRGFAQGWTPSGNLLWNPLGSGQDLYISSLDGGHAVQTDLGESGRRRGLGALRQLRWTATGNAILFSAIQGDSRNLWSIPISEETGKVAGEPQRLTAGAGDDVQPSMANDGRIVFANQSVKTDLWSVPVDANRGKLTGEIERLTNDAALDRLPFLSADGRSWCSFRIGRGITTFG